MEYITVTDASNEGKTKRPTNIAAERAALAGLCQFGNEVAVDVSEIITNDCFTTHLNTVVFKCIGEVLTTSTSVDVPSIISTATVLGFGDIIKDKQNADFIRSLFGFQISKENCIKNAKIIRKLDITRKAQDIAKKIYIDLSDVTGVESIDAIVSKIEQPVFDYTVGLSSGNEDKTELMGDGIDQYLDYLAQERPDIVGIPSPWPIYNTAIGGGRRRGGVYLTAARPKTGKSSYAINDGVHVASLGIPVLYLDSEMSKQSQLPRILACLSSQDMQSIERGAFADNDIALSSIKTAARKIGYMPFYYRRIAGKPFEEILSIIRRWVIKDVGVINGVTKPCLVIYDYFKLMNSDTMKEMQEHQALGFQIQDLCDLCNLYEFSCSAYVQTNRDGITKDTSDVLSQSDRLLWLCSSLAILKRKTTDEMMADGPENGNMKLTITPDQRFGPGLDDGDWVNFAFEKDKCQIKELSTRHMTKKSNGSGFDAVTADSIDVENSEDGFTDDDFDTPAQAFRDDSYRKH